MREIVLAWNLNIILRRGVTAIPHSPYRAGATKAQMQESKIAPGVLKFILVFSLYQFNKKNSSLPPKSRGRATFNKLRGQWVVQSNDFKFGNFENIWSNMHSKVCLQLPFSKIFSQINP